MVSGYLAVTQLIHHRVLQPTSITRLVAKILANEVVPHTIRLEDWHSKCLVTSKGILICVAPKFGLVLIRKVHSALDESDALASSVCAQGEREIWLFSVRFEYRLHGSSW